MIESSRSGGPETGSGGTSKDRLAEAQARINLATALLSQNLAENDRLRARLAESQARIKALDSALVALRSRSAVQLIRAGFHGAGAAVLSRLTAALGRTGGAYLKNKDNPDQTETRNTDQV